MNIFFKILVIAFGITFCSVGNSYAQWDIRGCSDYGTNITYPETLESSLWTFRSNVWDGYVDFQEGGKYWTHWGYGTWTVQSDGKVRMANDYNDKVYVIVFTDNGFRYEGVRDDGLKISGKLLCAKYQGPGPVVPEDVKQEISGYYQILLGRGAKPKELEANFRQYNQGATLDAIKETLMSTKEYRDKVAAAAAAAQFDGSPLGW